MNVVFTQNVKTGHITSTTDKSADTKLFLREPVRRHRWSTKERARLTELSTFYRIFFFVFACVIFKDSTQQLWPRYLHLCI